jgi:MOSC domain-containing protein YiiM
MAEPTVLSVSRSATRSFSKGVEPEIRLLAGLGVEGDIHAGATVRHRYHIRRMPGAPNRCQVHLLQAELFAELALRGIDVGPGAMGENVTTLGLDLLGLGRGTRLCLGDEAIVEVTGLREPCVLMDGLRPGLMQACLSRGADRRLVRKAGVMAVVILGGVVRAGDLIRVERPAEFRALEPV